MIVATIALSKIGVTNRDLVPDKCYSAEIPLVVNLNKPLTNQYQEISLQITN